MTRRLVLIAIAVAAFLAGAVPAQAAFTDQAAVTATVGTVTVQPPSGISLAGTTCSPSGTVSLRLGWVRSTTARVSSYRVRMYTDVGYNTTLGTLGPTATGYSASVRVSVNFRPTTYTFTVTTMTDYGWATESAQTVAVTC